MYSTAVKRYVDLNLYLLHSTSVHIFNFTIKSCFKVGGGYHIRVNEIIYF